MVSKVHFICRGNALRSYIADAYLKSLALPEVEVTSSGTVAEAYRVRNVDHLRRTRKLLTRHHLSDYMKPESTQLTQARVDAATVNVCVNQRVYDEARKIVQLPENTVIWHIDDIGEGTRLATEDGRGPYEETIYQEVISNVNELVRTVIQK